MSIFDPNITIAEVKTLLLIPGSDLDIGTWLNKIANLISSFGVGSFFSLTEIEEETIWDNGFCTEHPIQKLIEVKIKNGHQNILEPLSNFSFAKGNKYAISNCNNSHSCQIIRNLNRFPDLEIFDPSDKIFESIFVIVKYETGINLSDPKIKADFLKIIEIFYSEFGLNFSPNQNLENGGVKRESVDGTSIEYFGNSQTNQNKNYYFSRFPIVAGILSKYQNKKGNKYLSA